MTIGIQGRLQLSIDGASTSRPLDAAIEGLQLDLDYLMENGYLTFSGDVSRVEIELVDVTLRLSLDADEVLSRGGTAMIRGLEKDLQG